MDRQIAPAETKAAAKQLHGSSHLMCRASLWGIAGFLACAYFAWISYSHVAHNDYDWPHDAWTAGTYVVWIVLLAALTLDTRCLRERIFFGVLVLNFVIGFGLTLWSSVPPDDVRQVRLVTSILWALAALVSLTTIGRARSVGGEVKQE
ncbi:MAG TPA: hypothetical protein VF819_10445 [Nitrospira sp.]